LGRLTVRPLNATTSTFEDPATGTVLESLFVTPPASPYTR
jgi:hypothetical protein